MGNRYSTLCGSEAALLRDHASVSDPNSNDFSSQQHPTSHTSESLNLSSTVGFDLLSHLSLLPHSKAAKQPSSHPIHPIVTTEPSGTVQGPGTSFSPSDYAEATAVASVPLRPFELPPSRVMGQQLHHYGLHPEDINLTRALLRRCPRVARAATTAAGSRSNSSDCSSSNTRPSHRWTQTQLWPHCSSGGGGPESGALSAAAAAGSPPGPASTTHAGFVISAPTLGPPLLTDDEAAAPASTSTSTGEMLRPPPAETSAPATTATVSAGDGRSQLLLLGSVQLVDAGEGQGVGAAGGALRAEWDIPLDSGAFSDRSANEPCGCNVRVASPAFRVPVPPTLTNPVNTGASASGSASAAPAAAAAAPGSADSGRQAGASASSGALWSGEAISQDGTSYWRLCWALFDHDASRVSLYLLHTPHAGGKPCHHHRHRDRDRDRHVHVQAEDPADVAGGHIGGSPGRKDNRGGALRGGVFAISEHSDAVAASPSGPGLGRSCSKWMGGSSSASNDPRVFRTSPGTAVRLPDQKPDEHLGRREEEREEGEWEPEELWLTWRMEVAGMNDSGEVVRRVVVPGELAHLFRPGQRGWGVQALLSASELDGLLGCSRLRVAATLVHPPCAAEEVVGGEGVAPAYLRNRAADVVAAAAATGAGAGAGAGDGDGDGNSSCSGGGGNAGGTFKSGKARGRREAGRPLLTETIGGSCSGVTVVESRKCTSPGQQPQDQRVPRLLPPIRPLMERIRPVCECEVLLASLSPRILVVDDFLPACLCDALRAVAEPRLIRSRVSTGAETPSRVSQSTFFTGDSARMAEVVAVEARIQQLMERPEVTGGGRPTLVKSEALQVVSYDVGGFYSEHYDNKAGGIISRAATIIVYLEDTPQGGATFFPKSTGLPSLNKLCRSMPALDEIPLLTQQLHGVQCPRPGLRVFPAKGRAVIFWSRLLDGKEDLTSLHSAETVRAGTKWICTRWFKELVAV